ncbi:hypothetical protein TOPH_00371 [Tolypocladium ophioglossoides CBS 100239]|uniref:Uncharacterized protein n=1 Tax=Tolypocladium ophioglossoides (strain CBS 100239) TaxID=1163406 RepID=A0A0L0NMX7_TOLOC|nr:hypothetical protein TOPH_00371 [Tolypocladium ophioglossoides CBS 100239]
MPQANFATYLRTDEYIGLGWGAASALPAWIPVEAPSCRNQRASIGPNRHHCRPLPQDHRTASGDGLEAETETATLRSTGPA